MQGVLGLTNPNNTLCLGNYFFCDNFIFCCPRLVLYSYYITSLGNNNLPVLIFLLSIPPFCVSSSSRGSGHLSAFLVHGFKAIHTHGYSIHLPLPVGSSTTASFGVPCSMSSSGSQGMATCPPVAAPIRFVGLVFPLRHGMSLLPPWRSI